MTERTELVFATLKEQDLERVVRDLPADLLLDWGGMDGLEEYGYVILRPGEETDQLLDNLRVATS